MIIMRNVSLLNSEWSLFSLFTHYFIFIISILTNYFLSITFIMLPIIFFFHYIHYLPIIFHVFHYVTLYFHLLLFSLGYPLFSTLIIFIKLPIIFLFPCFSLCYPLFSRHQVRKPRQPSKRPANHRSVILCSLPPAISLNDLPVSKWW